MIEENSLAILFKDMGPKRYPKGQILIYEGDPPENIYYLSQGYVKVYHILDSGAERVIFIYGHGDVFPLTSYLSQAGVVRYFYECMTDVEVNVLPSGRLEKKIKDDMTLGESLIRYTYDLNQQFFQRIDVLSVNDARSKIISLLFFLVNKVGTSAEKSELCVPLTSQTIANMCGLTRETTSAQLQHLREQGIVSGYKTIIVDVPKLEKLSTKLGIRHFNPKS